MQSKIHILLLIKIYYFINHLLKILSFNREKFCLMMFDRLVTFRRINSSLAKRCELKLTKISCFSVFTKFNRFLFLFFISLFTYINAESITFNQLANLASNDLNKTIFFDEDIKDYSLNINLSNHYEKGELYEYFKNVLINHDMTLKYNNAGDFYYVKQLDQKKVHILPPKPVLSDKDILHYYTYSIKHITNKDVLKSMKIFDNIKYTYLEQSDMIAFSSTKDQYHEIVNILKSADNKVLSKTIKITLFAVRKNRLKEFGTEINKFDFSLDSSLNTVLDSFKNNVSKQFKLDTLSNFSITMRALKSYAISDIYQEPIILLTNGQRSSTNAVINLPYLKTTASVDSQTNSLTEQYEYKDIGLQINILPKIKNNWVYLNLDLVLEELISNDDNKPITQKISYKNTVKVEKGKPLLLTGIQKVFKRQNDKSIPLLSDIPFFGNFFKYTTKNNEDQNINILIEII